MHAVLPEAGNAQLLYGWLIHVLSYALGKSAFAFSFLAVVLIYVQALLLNAIANRHRLFTHNTYLVAFCYIAIGSLSASFGQFNAQLIINFLILFALNEIFQMKQAQNANKYLFNAAFLLMLAALFQFSALFLILFLFIALLILRPFNIREWMIAFIGLGMPLYILIVCLFCTDKLQLMHFWPDLGISLPRQLQPAQYYLGVFIGLIIWVSISLYNMQLQLPKAPIYLRRCWISLSVLLIVCLLAATFTDSDINAAWMICLPAFSLMLAHAFVHERNKKMNTISFYFALALIVFCQIFLP